MINDPILSIYVPTYNHEKYISQALDGILSQKTDYPFEVLIGDDASCDAAPSILKSYEERYPGRFNVFYRETNMQSLGLSNIGDLKLKTRGKYIMALEGDDFYIDDRKLEKQISFLETHPEYIACAHNCVIVDENSRPTGELYPECTSEEYTLEHFVDNILPGQTATLMVRNYMKQDLFDRSLVLGNIIPGDRMLAFSLLLNGRVFCMQETMSAYRHVTNSGTSFSATYKYDFHSDERSLLLMINYAQKLGNKTGEKCAEVLYFRNLIRGIMRKKLKVGESLKYFNNIKHKISCAALLLKQQLRQGSLRNDPIKRRKRENG